jgi:hypothetical protein
MAKPILVVTLSGIITNQNNEKCKEIKDRLSKQLKNEYHVLVVIDSYLKKSLKIECFNDISGLDDVDIRKLIKETLNKKPRAFVLDSKIKNNTNRVDRINRAARLGKYKKTEHGQSSKV